MFSRLILAGALLLPLAAWAEDPPKLVQPSQFTFTVTPEEANVLGQGLMELPMKTALPILQKLQAQSSQQTAAEVKKAEPEKK